MSYIFSGSPFVRQNRQAVSEKFVNNFSKLTQRKSELLADFGVEGRSWTWRFVRPAHEKFRAPNTDFFAGCD